MTKHLELVIYAKGQSSIWTPTIKIMSLNPLSMKLVKISDNNDRQPSIWIVIIMLLFEYGLSKEKTITRDTCETFEWCSNDPQETHVLKSAYNETDEN